MAKDYAPKRKKKKKSNHNGLWWLSGFLMGIMVTAIVVSKVQPHDLSRQAASSEPQSKIEMPSAVAQTTPQKAKKPVFDFYTLLPEMQVNTPGMTIKQSTAALDKQRTIKQKPAPQPTEAKQAPKQNYMLQLASYRKYNEAETEKAKLALLGYEAVIEPVTLAGKQWYRVRLGPFANKTTAEKMRTALKNQQINSLVLKQNT